uniref:DUF5641 domain-containing protein n=1 Tax=Trichogramma kaykai TaxID=54128 RepID=A0ABD2W9Q5_9HYME
MTGLQKREKWIHPQENIKLDQIVILIDRNQPCLQWRLGRVIELHPGDDGVVRVVTLKTSQGVFKRNVRSLCLLPID